MIGVQMPSVRDVGPSSSRFPAIRCSIAVGSSKWPVSEREGCAISLIPGRRTGKRFADGCHEAHSGRQNAVCLTPQPLRRSRLGGCDGRAKTPASREPAVLIHGGAIAVLMMDLYR
jgi:hypothetical protein